METREWLESELKKLAVDENSMFVIKETINYIENLNADNESLQIALEGEIWSPKKWSDK